MKKSKLLLLTLAVAVLAAFCVTGCSRSKSGSAAGEAATGEKVYVVKYAHAQPDDHFSNFALLKMQEYIGEKGNGRLVMELFPNGQLGSDRQLIESVQLGTLEMCNAVSASFSATSKTAMVFDLPFLFTDDENAYKILDGEIGQQIMDQINNEATGYRIMTFGVSGLRHITNNVRPIRTPADLKGVKLRCMENQVHLDMFRALGANPTPMSIGEVYTSLQQNIVDGQENPIANIYSYRFHEVQKYLSLTGHVYLPQFDVISTKFWDSLPEDLKVVMEDAELLRRDKQREYAKEFDLKALEAIEERTEINSLSAAEVKLFRDACVGVYEKYKNEIGAELVDNILRAIQ